MTDIVARLRKDARSFYGMTFDGEPCEGEMIVLRDDVKWRAADEIERLRAFVERKQQQYERAQRYWVDAAQKALKGDTEHLRLRVDLALSGPIEMTETKE